MTRIPALATVPPTRVPPTRVPPTRYRYLTAATTRTCPPDLVTDSRLGTGTEPADGWIVTTAGSPFGGRSIGWRGLTVMDAGIDLECCWDAPVWLDRLLLDPDVLDQVDRVRILVPHGDRLRQIGQLDLSSRTTDEVVLEGPGPIGADIGALVQRCVLRFETRLLDLRLAGGLTLVGTDTSSLGIFPAAAGSTDDGDGPDLDDLAAVTVHPYGQLAAELSAIAVERAAEVLGHHWQAAEPITADGEGPSTLVLNLGGVAPDPAHAPGAHRGAPSPTLAPDGFVLTVEPDRITVTGDRLGLRYGLETVLQQVILDGRVCLGRFVEEPAHSFRGVHLPLPGPSQVDYFHRLIRHLVIPARFNTVIIEVAGGMEFARHPEINEVWQSAHAQAGAGEIAMPGHFSMVAPGECLPQGTTAELADELRAAGLDVIPEVQSLSHVQYLTLAHPEIAEVAGEVDNTAAVDLFAADQPPAKHPSCYCPSNPAAHALIADVLAEILDVFRPTTWVHLGHDEVYELGVCPTCITQDPAQLFADDVNRLSAQVAERGLRPIIWADMLQPDARYRAAAAIDQLPDDLVMMDFIWYFHRERDTEPYLLDAGREVIIGNLYSSHYPRWQERSTRAGILGGQVSTWIALEDEPMAREGKYFDLAMVGVMLWSRQYHRHHRPGLTARINQLLGDLRPRMTDGPRPVAGAGLELLTATSEQTVTIPTRYGQSSHHQIDLARTIPPIGFQGPGEFRFEIAAGMTQIQLLHALTRSVPRIAWEPLTEIGRYRFTAADGTELGVLPLTAGGTIGPLHRRPAQPLPTSYYRHQGYGSTYRADPVHLGQTEAGQELTLHRVVWPVPDGAGPIEAVLEVDPDVGTAVVLAAATGHRN